MAPDWPLALLGVNAAGCIDQVNPAAQALTGWAAPMLLGRPLALWLRPGVAKHHQGLRPDGWPFVCDIQRSSRSDGGQWLHLLPLPDVMACEQAARQPLTLAMELADVVVWQHDLQHDRIDLDPEGLRRLGMNPRPDGWAPDDFLRLVHPDDQPAMLAAARQAAASHQPVNLTVRYQTPSGGWRQVLTRRIAQRSPDGVAIRLVGVAMDITERQQAREQLREAGERVALVTRGLGIGTWVRHFASLRHEWDEQMWRLRGRAPESACPHDDEMLAMVHPDDVAAMQQRIASDNIHGEPERQYEFRVVWPDGQVRWLASRSVLVRDEAGQPVQRVGVNWDITDSRSAASARQEQALAQRENQAKSELLARFSHELRTPLNAILGLTQLLLREGEGCAPALRQERLGHVLSAGEHLLALVNDVLELTQAQGDDGRSDSMALDLLTPRPPTAAPAKPSTSTPQRRRLLYIEDNPINMMIVEELTRLRGDIDFYGATDGQQGLHLAHQLQPDLVLLDLHLPDLHGHQVLAQLRADGRTRHIPCVALSANALPADIEAALGQGFADYWTKPLDFSVFDQALATLFGPAPAATAG